MATEIDLVDTTARPLIPLLAPRDDDVRARRFGQCRMCKERQAIYCCPKCLLKTCSLQCVREHRQRFQCSGKRARTKFAPVAEMTTNTLQHDFDFVASVSEQVDRRRRRPVLREYSRTSTALQILRRNAAFRRGILLLTVCAGMSRRRENTSYFDIGRQELSWRVELRFQWPKGVGVDAERKTEEQLRAEDTPRESRISVPRMPESVSFQALLDRILCPPREVSSDAEEAFTRRRQLRRFARAYDADKDSVRLLLKVVDTPANAPQYYAFAPSECLQQCLRNVVLLEFPTLLVMLKSDMETGQYTVIPQPTEPCEQIRDALMDGATEEAPADHPYTLPPRGPDGFFTAKVWDRDLHGTAAKSASEPSPKRRKIEAKKPLIEVIG
ncbi:MAG: hypothetical protein MHM6MM_003805 [Cercozoa sp. M6MM]